MSFLQDLIGKFNQVAVEPELFGPRRCLQLGWHVREQTITGMHVLLKDEETGAVQEYQLNDPYSVSDDVAFQLVQEEVLRDNLGKTFYYWGSSRNGREFRMELIISLEGEDKVWVIDKYVELTPPEAARDQYVGSRNG